MFRNDISCARATWTEFHPHSRLSSSQGHEATERRRGGRGHCNPVILTGLVRITWPMFRHLRLLAR